MKCFFHRQADAIGSCKNCCRGLCPDCAVDLVNGLACRGRCEAEVQALVELQRRSKTSYDKAAAAATRTAIWMSLMGLVFVIGGLLTLKTVGVGSLIFGALFLLGAAFQFITARRYRRVD